MTTTVFAHGCWDGLHIGHVKHLEAARQLGDRLIVGVTGDAFVAKGPGRPRYSTVDRATAVRALSCVEATLVVNAADPCEMLQALKPDVYVKGREYQGRDIPELAVVAEYGGRVEFVGETLGSSSADANAAQADPRLQPFRDAYTTRDVDDALAAIRGLRATVVGDGIVDEYVPVEHVGLTNKGDAISLATSDDCEGWDGGAWVIAAHLKALGVATDRRIIHTATKRRYYRMAGHQVRVHASVEQLHTPFRPITPFRPDGQLLVIADFGHGAIVGSDWDTRGAAVMCQANSLNRHLNTYRQYERVGMYALDKRESELVGDAAPHADRWYITAGEAGTVDRGGHSCPALEDRPVDPMGAGDAFFAVAAACYGAKVPEGLSLLLAQIAGAQLTRVLGNAKPVDVDALRRTAQAILA